MYIGRIYNCQGRVSGLQFAHQRHSARLAHDSTSDRGLESADQGVLAFVKPFWYFSGVSRPALAQDTTVARTIRFPAGLRERIACDAERCGRSFEGQVLALLRRHYGEDVDIAPSPQDILALATASLADVPSADARALVRRLKEVAR